MKRCRSCDAPIIWVKAAATGAWMPLEPSDGGNVVVESDLFGEQPTVRVVAPGAGAYVSHHSRCPDAKEWRR